jgi:hypothetical protein
MKNRTYLTSLILSACISLFICPEVSGRINKADGYGAFAACDTWQKWVEHITGGDFEFTDFARHDNEECEELAAYVYERFMTNAGDDELATEAQDDKYMTDAYGGEYASDTTDDYTVPGYDERYDEEGWSDPSYDRSYYSDPGGEDSYGAEYNIEHYYLHAYYAADEYASFYDDERPDMDDNYEAGDYEDYEDKDEDDCEDYDDEYDEAEYEDCPSEYEEDAYSD